MLNPLQVTDGFHIVGQHSTDGYGRFLDFLFHQVGRRRITQVGTQFFNFDGKQCVHQFAVAAVGVITHQVRRFRKNGTSRTLPERVLFCAHRDQSICGIIKIRLCQALLPQIPCGTAGIQRIQDFIDGGIIVTFNKFP